MPVHRTLSLIEARLVEAPSSAVKQRSSGLVDRAEAGVPCRFNILGPYFRGSMREICTHRAPRNAQSWVASRTARYNKRLHWNNLISLAERGGFKKHGNCQVGLHQLVSCQLSYLQYLTDF